MDQPEGDPTRDQADGPTPNGGVRSEVYYHDADGNPCPKSRAAGGEVIEYDADGQSIFRTYFTLMSPE